MPRKRQAPVQIPDEEILQHANVPVWLAAQYIGWSTSTLYNALQDGRAPFGFASCHENDEGKTVWAYNISPRMLTAYKNGELPYMGVKDVVKMISGEVEALINGDWFAKVLLRGMIGSMEKLEGGV